MRAPAPVPKPPGFVARLGRRLSGWRRNFLPLPDEIVEDYLGHGERVIYDDHPSLRAFVVEHALLVLALFVCVGLFVGVGLQGSASALVITFLLLSVVTLVLVLQRLSERYTSYVITSVRMMRISGVLTRHVHSIPWMRVTDLGYEQDALGRLFGYATVHIESANEESGLRNLDGIGKPKVFNQYLVDMVVAKQGPTAPGWEEVGQGAPAGVLLAAQRVGVRQRMREARRRRREQKQAEAGGEGAGERRPSDADAPSGPSGEGEVREPRDEARRRGAPRAPVPAAEATRELGAGPGADAGGQPGGQQSGDHDGIPDPLRGDPESSVPWGQE